MPKMTFGRTAGMTGALSLQMQKSIEGDNGIFCKKTLPAAKSGTLTTRTDANTGTITGASGHGVTTGAKLCIFWDGGVRYNVTVGTVSGDSIPIDLGGGTDLPATTTALTMMVQNPETSGWTFAGDSVLGLAAGADVPFVAMFFATATVTAAYYSDDAAGSVFAWNSDESAIVANPLTGASITSIAFAHGSLAAAEVGVGAILL